jgi:hypothetical protein
MVNAAIFIESTRKGPCYPVLTGLTLDAAEHQRPLSHTPTPCLQLSYLGLHPLPEIREASEPRTTSNQGPTTMLATPSQTPEGFDVPPSPVVAKITRGHSCILCQQRKVKCDRAKPCSNCIKARVECIPSAPTIPRRRRRKLSEQDIGTRLRKYEQLLKKHGVKFEDDDLVDEPESSNSHNHVERGLPLDVPRAPRAERGMLFADKGNSRYVEKYANTLFNIN